jgi:hypothetical protein
MRAKNRTALEALSATSDTLLLLHSLNGAGPGTPSRANGHNGIRFPSNWTNDMR